MSSTRKYWVLAALSLLSSAGVLCLFLLCCWSAAADAQGAVMFFFAAPFLGIGFVLSILLGWLARRSRAGRVALGSGIGLGVLVAFFFFAASNPPLRPFSDGVIHMVAKGYELITGKTPFAADKGL